MSRRSRGMLTFVLACAMVLTSVAPTAAAKKVALSSKKATIKVGESKKITVKNAKKKVVWSIKSGKKNIALKKKKKNSVTIQGKKAGSAKVLAKVGSKKLVCSVTVKAKEKEEEEKSPESVATAAVSSAPAQSSAPTSAQSSAPAQGESTAPVPTETVLPTRTPVPTVEPVEGEFRYEGLDLFWIADNIDPEKPVVAMTFDDGPGSYNGFVDCGMRIQQALKDAGAHATFFYIGSHIQHDEKSKEEVKQAVEWGFEIANHSWDTNGLNGASLKEDAIKKKIDDTNALLKEISGYNSFLFRAPNVAYSNTMYKAIDAPFIDVSCWSNDYQDAVDKDKMVDNMKKAKDGDIINMHSVHEKTAQAVPEILAYYKEKGVQVVSVSELFAIKGKQLMNGKMYRSVNG